MSKKVGYFVGRGKRKRFIKLNEIDKINSEYVAQYKASTNEAQKSQILRNYFNDNEPFLSRWKYQDEDTSSALTAELYLVLPNAFDLFNPARGLTLNSFITFYKRHVLRKYRVDSQIVRPRGSWKERAQFIKETDYFVIDDANEEWLAGMTSPELISTEEESHKAVSIEEETARLIASGFTGRRLSARLSDFELELARKIRDEYDFSQEETRKEPKYVKKTVRHDKL